MTLGSNWVHRWHGRMAAIPHKKRHPLFGGFYTKSCKHTLLYGLLFLSFPSPRVIQRLCFFHFTFFAPLAFLLHGDSYSLTQRCFIGNSFALWKKTSAVVDEGPVQIYFSSLADHGYICITFAVAGVGPWWGGGPAPWRIWQAKCEIKRQMRSCSLAVVRKADGDREARGCIDLVTVLIDTRSMKWANISAWISLF